MKRKLIFCFLMCGLVAYLFAGTTGKLAGTVIDSKTGDPLIGVNVILKDTHMGASTDTKGEYFVMNLPVGAYTVEASMIGYQKQIVESVLIRADMTTRLDFNLSEEVVAGEGVVVVAKKEKVLKDLTATINVAEASQIRELPVTNYKQVLDLQTGVVVVPIRLESAGPYGQFDSTPDDGVHSRGGRTNETAYLLNGISIKDPIWGAFYIEDLPIMGISQLVSYKGTYLAEYGEGMSSVMNLVSTPNTVKPSFNYTAYTDNLDFINKEDLNTYNHELVYQGPVPGFGDKLLTNIGLKYNQTDGRFYGFIYPEYRDTEGKDKSGEPEKVPMNYNDYIGGIGSLQYALTPNIKILLGGFYNDKKTSYYNHFFKYNPYGNPRVQRDYSLGYLKFKQVLSHRYFYELSLSRYNIHFKSSIFDDLESSLVEDHLQSPERFSVSGIDYVWFKTQSQTDELSFYIVGQVTPIHQMKAGFGYKMNDLNYERRNPTAQDVADSLKMKAWEAYNRKPYSLNVYIQDKIEFNKIGMIMNLGLRYDRIYPETYYMTDILRPSESEMLKTTYTDYFSPRFGVSYPISNNMALRFAYGIYYQFPQYYLLNQGVNEEEAIYPNYSLGEVTQIGDGAAKPEKTTSYEAGIQVAVNNETSLNVTAFYRDMSDLMGLKTIYGPRTYQLFTNEAYGIARGIEVNLSSTISSNFWMSLNYTYSNVNASKQSIWYIPLYPQNRTFAADWDIPHKLTFQMNYEHTSRFGISIIGDLRSGYPYSPNALNPNSERGPSQTDLNINLYKTFQKFGFQQTFFVHVTNVFNERNVYWVYTDTGKPGVDANPGTSDDYTHDPTAWGPPRLIRVGLTLSK